MPRGRRPMARAIRALADVHASLAEDRPVSFDEALAVHERLLSRRALLATAGVVGAGALVAGPVALARPTLRRSANDARIVIVGAGLAGLTCAYKLSKRGVSVDVYEARDRVGGRCWTARDFLYGQTAEHGGEFIDTRHMQIRRLAAELGLTLYDTFAGYAAERNTSSLLVFDGERQARKQVTEGLDAVVRKMARDLKRIGPYYWNLASPAAREFDQMTMREWVDANVPGGSTSTLGEFIDTIIATEYGIDPENTSAITVLDFFVTPYAGGPADERYHTTGGNDLIAHRIAATMPEGTIHLNAPLLSMSKRADASYSLLFGDSTQAVEADIVVLCLPFTTLRDVDLTGAGLSAKRMASIQDLAMGTNAKVLLQFRDRLPSFHHWNGEVIADSPQNWSWDSTVGEPGRGGIFTFYTGGAVGAAYDAAIPHGPAPQAVIDETLGFLDTYLPGTKASFDGKAWLDSWADDPWVKGSYAAFGPGQWTSYWGYLGLAEGNVHFAGEHTSTYAQGYLDGGVESGERAAREVLKAIGRRAA